MTWRSNLGTVVPPTLALIALADGGSVMEPLETALRGDHVGACVDRLGTSRMVDIGRAPV